MIRSITSLSTDANMRTTCWHLQVSIWTVEVRAVGMSLTWATVSPFTSPQPHLESQENLANFNSHEVRAFLPSTNPKLPAGVKAFPPYVVLSPNHPHICLSSRLTHEHLYHVWFLKSRSERNTKQLKLIVCHLVIYHASGLQQSPKLSNAPDTLVLCAIWVSVVLPTFRRRTLSLSTMTECSLNKSYDLVDPNLGVARCRILANRDSGQKNIVTWFACH
jgi:hypothetical protein